MLIKYYGCGVGQPVNQPLDTITAKDRFGLVTVKGVDCQIVDIGLRMLTPRELYNARRDAHDIGGDQKVGQDIFDARRHCSRAGV